MDVKWLEASPRHRQSTAEGLTTITLALVDDGLPFDGELVRRALRTYAFNTAARESGPPPAEFVEPLRWVGDHSRSLADLMDPGILRAVLGAIARNLDGSPAAASTTNRKRAALSGAIGYAIETGGLSSNPLPTVKAIRRRASAVVDPRVVVSPGQARALLAAVKETTPALYAYFASLYFAGLRPGEAANLRSRDLTLPEAGWGEALLAGSYQASRAEWTDNGLPGEERSLKHRAPGSTRRVPLAPDLVDALRWHLDEFGTGAEGRLFVTRSGKLGRPVAQPFVRPVGSAMAGRALDKARAVAFTAQEYDSELAATPYDLRHACVSAWLAAGVDPAQVAAWAGHGLGVLLTVYAHAIEGREDIARRRITAFLEG